MDSTLGRFVWNPYSIVANSAPFDGGINMFEWLKRFFWGDSQSIRYKPHDYDDEPRDDAYNWRSRIKRNILAIDVETTGLYEDDRIISFSGILFDIHSIMDRNPKFETVYLVFDPGKKSHPKAEQKHGFSDFMLRHQQTFAEHASSINDLIKRADVVVGHNIDFDLAFIEAELLEFGIQPADNDFQCTMELYRELYPGRRANLASAAAEFGYIRQSNRHTAIEDAWLALCLYVALNRIPFRLHALPLASLVGQMQPSNLQPVPPLPDGPLPRRKRRPKLKVKD
jgi:DNA polymerase III subunit epsilon